MAWSIFKHHLLPHPPNPYEVTAGKEIYFVLDICWCQALCRWLLQTLSYLILITLPGSRIWASTQHERDVFGCWELQAAYFASPVTSTCGPRLTGPARPMMRCLGRWQDISLNSPTTEDGLYFYLLNFPFSWIMFQTNTCGHCPITPKSTNAIC
jgi:hypothetical protein